ncbi:hypothetical protein P170DRAFT_349559 [Aspergillus steynii IBT 23096]|uniref:Six-hairpin glycosidase n=1 Tax=Aspergillus steynii IBT 23096 TaxID=1392250 RepID=A0A2I2GGY7_9EURO|nr:uncharacterized protein P170DRAFT_349559 [Aspergillus steynii IBT 23096]PLB52097.1 hypothetical protein P170DRAFT_349559 [Aspergillus steynii IBT 23096]
MSWISVPRNAPWQPQGSHWGLGYASVGSLKRMYWSEPTISASDRTVTTTYQAESLKLTVTREVKDFASFEECYAFTNTGDAPLKLNGGGTNSLAIYAPFNDHYTNTTDVLEHRAHAHIWASGGSSSWVKMTRMGLRGPHLGLVLTEGKLAGYSVESRDTVTSSNTRGVFLLHPDLPELGPQETSKVCWSMFWHHDWEDFFRRGSERSKQLVHVEVSPLTAFLGEDVNVTISQGSWNEASLDGVRLSPAGNGSIYKTSIPASKLGERKLTLTTGDGTDQHNSTIVLNTVSSLEKIIQKRTKFIANNQHLSTSFPDPHKAGAFVVYDNQMNAPVTFDTASDRNTARERIGMGVLFARWVQRTNDTQLLGSLRIYYNYVINHLQDSSGYVYNRPIGSATESKRLYNWPWVMQLHLNMAKIDNSPITSQNNYTATPRQRLLDTIESFYSEGGVDLYAINLPIYEGLTYLRSAADNKTYNRVHHLFTTHGANIARLGPNYPAFEVNYEQSIIAPAATILLELHRITNNTAWLDAAKPHFERLVAFGGRQPDHHLYDVAIRHWDGYWFGKDRMWGDTFPHYWSTLTAIAMHHYAKAMGETSYERRAEGIFRSNLVLFTDEGRGHCAFVYPTSVNGRKGHYNDPYANDQDWALANWLQVLEG